MIEIRCVNIGSCTTLYRFMLRMLYRPYMADTCSIQAGRPAPDARCPRELEMPTGFLHGEIESRVPRAPASVSGGMAMELRRCVYNASTYRTAVSWPCMHMAESFTRAHSSSTGILSKLSVSVEKLKSGRCASACKRPLNMRFVHVECPK